MNNAEDEPVTIDKSAKMSLAIVITILSIAATGWAWLSTQFEAASGDRQVIKDTIRDNEAEYQRKFDSIDNILNNRSFDRVYRHEVELWIERAARENPTLSFPEFPRSVR